jgi:hypothetical protein
MNRLTTLLCVCAITLAGCATTYGPDPHAFNERIELGYASATYVHDTAGLLLQEGRMTDFEATNLQEIAKALHGSIDSVSYLEASPLAEDKLAATLIALSEFERYLNSRRDWK